MITDNDITCKNILSIKEMAMSYEIKIGGFIPKHIEKCVILQFASVHFIITNKLSKSQEQLRE